MPSPDKIVDPEALREAVRAVLAESRRPVTVPGRVAEMTEAELFALPTTLNLETAARAIGFGRDYAYRLARDGKFPIRFLPGHGSRIRISKTDLMAYLGYRQEAEDGAA